MLQKWRQLSLVASALALGLPLFVIVAALLSLVFGGDFTTLDHLWATVIPEYIRHSVLLMIGVAIGVITLGLAPPG